MSGGSGWFWARIASCNSTVNYSAPSLQNSRSPETENTSFSPTAIAEAKNRQVFLSQNTPNPASSQTLIRYDVPETFQSAEVLITTSMGAPVKKFSIIEGGPGELVWDVSGSPSGIYLYSLIVDGRLIATKRMSILK